ncbi:MAG TPA: TonB-dependent receptor [Candidatus Aminicenantes bacterium]|nr:TonB-dependent receptor [Candidatus Aminicenantes bacterium]HRY64783.1 TonB-dependent receptor [Candidatus Aminicenantes bacterium]HRZ71696.1 TonB-dependent receptor [Candidatus Aminicenantes bacterium]
MKSRKLLAVVLTSLLLVPFLAAQVSRQTGVIRGTLTDMAGAPLPGANIVATSPGLMGSVSAVTDATGVYRLVNLPPGTYTLTAAMPSFKTVKKTGVQVSVGQTYTVNLQTEESALSEEVTVTGAAPVVDVESNKVTSVISTELLQNLPLNRSINNLFNITAGSAGTIGSYSGSIHGANSGSTAYEIDGVNGESPTTGGMQISPQYESIEEIEIATAGLPAQVGASGGSFISVVTKSGGNTFHGQAQAYYTAKGLNQMLFTNEELASLGRSKPAFAKYDIDGSFSLGGPIIKDRIWFFSTLDYRQNEYTLNNVPVTLEGTSYDTFTNPTKTYAPFVKLTTQLNKDMRLFFMFNGSFTKNLYYPSYYQVFESTTASKSNSMAVTANLNWMFGPNTYLDVRGGYNNLDWSLTSQPDSRLNPTKIDDYTGYVWSNKDGEEQYTIRRGETVSARLTHFLDNVLGGNHELGAGVEYVYSFDRLTVARGNPLTMHYYDGDSYAYAAQGMDRAIYGDGYIQLSNMGPNEGDSTKDLPGNRFGAYIQDSLSIKNRLTINIGLRYDNYWGGFGGATSTGTATDGLAYKMGEFVAETIGWNPYAAMTWDAMRKTMQTSALSPRIGLSYDLFGNGKTALKISWGRYYEAMPVMWFSNAQASIQQNYAFNWWDDNGNHIPDDPGVDTYAPTDGYWSFVEQDLPALRQLVAGKGEQYQLKAPWNNELVVSLSHELTKNLSVKLQYVNKLGRRDHWDTMYDTATRTYLSSLQDAPAGFWVPFTTTVPAVGDWDEATVTVYVPTNDYNWDNVVYRQASNPYSKRLYNGIEMTFDKRYANGWALGGSITLAKSKSITPYDPNYAVNGWGADINDIPLAIKLFGSFRIPLGFVGSFIYRHLEGGPLNYGGSFWDKSMDVSVYVPDSWLAEHNCVTWYNWIGVQLAPNGTHRQASWDNIDFRLEKQFKFNFGTVAVFADIFNLLGNKYVYSGLNPSGVWYPDDENTSSGTRVVDSYYQRVTSVSGVRIFKLSARVSF